MDAKTRAKVAMIVMSGATGKVPNKIMNSPTKFPVPGMPKVATAKNIEKAELATKDEHPRSGKSMRKHLNDRTLIGQLTGGVDGNQHKTHMRDRGIGNETFDICLREGHPCTVENAKNPEPHRNARKFSRCLWKERQGKTQHAVSGCFNQNPRKINRTSRWGLRMGIWKPAMQGHNRHFDGECKEKAEHQKIFNQALCPQSAIKKYIGTSISSQKKKKRNISMAKKTPITLARIHMRLKQKKPGCFLISFQEQRRAMTPRKAVKTISKRDRPSMAKWIEIPKRGIQGRINSDCHCGIPMGFVRE
ncbi:family transcriptional regulator [Lasius niger]|uniref:Family transcriptional regulator n=1 Tax=Lasius niger TaxID=67767 RepID=A0A0J7KHL7_LASNI|nr:family transcriptional regulator [Lasius niger]